MTDTDLVAKKIAVITSCVTQLRTLARPERLADDVREERFVEHTLQIAIQAALDIASHIVSDEQLGEPRTNRELFRLLEAKVPLSAELATRLGRMAGFRNVLVHGYDTVDLAIVQDLLLYRLDDLLAFADRVRQVLSLDEAGPT
jgi:uncharacterized protein YutE (UPF0331/DUF86 family)